MFEVIKYRSYRRGKNRCKRCGYKLDDPNLQNGYHDHVLEKYYDKMLIKQATNALKIFNNLTGIHDPQHSGKIVEWSRYNETKI